MTTVFLRRLLSILIAGCCVVLIGALIVGFVRFGLQHPTDVTLAQRIDAKKTLLFLKTSNRETFEQLVQRYTPAEISNTSTFVMETVPIGSSYEYAVLETGGGSAWIVSVKNASESEETITMTSSDDPLLLLPITKLSSSLKKSSLVRTYVRTDDETWLYTNPIVLLGTEKGPLATMLRGLLSEVAHILVLPRGSDEGMIILESPHPNYFNPIAATATSDKEALFEIASGSPDQDLRAAKRFIESTDPVLMEGFSGIFQHILQSLTGKTDIKSFSETMLVGPATLAVTASGSVTHVVFVGSSKNRALADTWIQSLNTSAGGARIREIIFPKRENVRRDVTLENQAASMQKASLNGWEVSQLGGEEAETKLFVARQATRYAIATDEPLLKKYIAPSLLPEDRTERRQEGSAIAGRIHIPWLMEKAEPLEQEDETFRELLRSALGNDAEDLVWDARPVDRGWLLNWSLSRSGSLLQPSLVK